MNTVRTPKETAIDQGKDGEINARENGTRLEWLALCFCC
jgi:hypothetical protein